MFLLEFGGTDDAVGGLQACIFVCVRCVENAPGGCRDVLWFQELDGTDEAADGGISLVFLFGARCCFGMQGLCKRRFGA